MTRYRNPIAALSELITKAFAALGDRDHPGGRNAFVMFPPRARSRHSSTVQTPSEGITDSIRHNAKRDA